MHKSTGSRMKSARSLSAGLFLSGLFISSIGSTTFIVGILTFYEKMNLSIFEVGQILGLVRITSVLTNFFFGSIGDRISARKILIFGETGALFCSLFMFWNADFSKLNDVLIFAGLAALRSFFTSIQSSSVQKIGKSFDKNFRKEGDIAVFINRVTFGSIFFAVIINLFSHRNIEFKYLIAFDAFSFLLNAIILYVHKVPIQIKDSTGSQFGQQTFKQMLVSKKIYFEMPSNLFTRDIILALVLMGANTLNVAIFLNHTDYIPLAAGGFGLAIWLVGTFPPLSKRYEPLAWCVLASFLFLQIVFRENPTAALLFGIIRNVSYWLIYNKISAEVMKTANFDTFATLASSRIFVIQAIGSLGEFWLGLKVIPIFFEGLYRAFLGYLVAVIYTKKILKESRNVLIYIAIFLLTCTQFSQNAVAEIKMKRVLNLPFSINKFVLDPHLMEDVASLYINRQIFRGLMKYTSELTLEKDLVVSYKVEEMGQVYTFTLDQNSKFSDGSTISSQDVIASFERMKKLSTAILQDLQSIKKVTAIDEKSVRFELHFADPFFIKNLAAVDCAILKLDKKLNLLPIYSGWYVPEFDLKENLTLVRNPHLKFDIFSPEQINPVYVIDAKDAIAKAKSGRIDSLEPYEVPNSDTEQLLKEGWVLRETQTARNLFLTLNPKLLNLDQRKAIFSAIHKLKTSAIPSGFTESFGMIPNVLSGHLLLEDIRPLVRNQKTKDKLMTIDSKFVLKLAATRGNTTEKIIAWIKNGLMKKGIQLSVSFFDIQDYFKVIRQGDYQAILRSKYLDYPDGMAVLTYFKYGIPINTFFLGNKSINSSIEAATREKDSNLRIALYKKIQIQLLKEFTYVPLVSGGSMSFLSSSKIKEIKPHPLGVHSLYFHEFRLYDK